MKAVIFDMDGVLIDSEEINIKLLLEYFQQQKILVPYSAILSYIGASSGEFWKTVREFNPNLNIEEAARAFRRYNQEQRISYEKILFPGVKEVLKKLKKSGWKIGLATSSKKEVALEVLQQCKIESFFDTFVCGNEVLRGKPEPDIFLEAARRIGSEPEECIVIEDSERGILGAKRAGMKVIGREDVRFAQNVRMADIVISETREVTEQLLKQLQDRRGKDMKLGFIGCGNMASALIRGVTERKIVTSEDIIASDLSVTAREKVKSYGVEVTKDNKIVAERASILILAVKPQYYESILKEIKNNRKMDQLVVTIAPGISLAWVESYLGDSAKIIRTMPNTPAMLGKGMTALCKNGNVTDEEKRKVCNIFEGVGLVEEIPESLMNVAVSVGSSSPAYVFLFIEAMADGAVADGMPREMAYRFAAQAVLGSAKMVLETGKHPGELKDMVCSPGGTTIDAVRSLEKNGFRGCVMEALRVCTEKSMLFSS